MVSWNDTLYCGFLDLDWHGDPDIDWGAYLTDDTLWHTVPGHPDGPLLFASVNGHLFMGGNANELNSLPFPGICEVIGGQPVPLVNNPMDGADIWAFEYWHGSYYFGGQISSLALGSRNVVAFDGVTQWTPLGEGIGGNYVNCITAFGDSLYVGGYFLPGSNVQSKHIQIWDGETWRPFFPQVEFIDRIKQMEVHEGALWILGTFQFSEDGPTYAILRYDGHQLCAIGGPEYNAGSGSRMAFFQGSLYKGMGTAHPGLEFEHVARLPLEGLVPDECVEVATGLGDPNQDVCFALHPNPVVDQLTITALNAGQDGTVEVHDVLGRSVLPPARITAPSMLIDLAQWPPGCYQLKMSTAMGARVKRFIKR